jgi:hypothetical protein
VSADAGPVAAGCGVEMVKVKTGPCFAWGGGGHVILDNYGMHKTQRIRRWLAQRPRFHLHCVFSASLRNPGTKASSNSGFKDDER